MNKTAMWVVGIIVVLGLGYFFFMGSSNSTGTNGMASTSGTSVASTNAPQGPSGTIAELMTHGSSTCTVNNSDANQNTSGTVYIGSGKMRGDFTSNSSVGSVESHMISDGTNVYVWSTGMTQGMKMPISQAQSSKGPNGQPSMYAEKVNYNCQAWSVDQSKFQLPNIKFVTLADMMGGGSAYGASASGGGSAGASAGSGAPSCAMCDAAPAGTQRDQCRAALGCK